MTDEARQRRRTWVTGGVLLVLAAISALVARGPLAGMVYAKDVFWALGALVLVIGIGRAGSITRRRPFPTTVVLLQILVANPLTAWYLSTLPLDDPQNPHAQEESWISVFMPYYGVVFVLTVLSAIIIGAMRALPSPWSWAPSWVLVWSWTLGWTSLSLFSAAPLDTPLSTIGAYLGLVSAQLGTLFLGGVAIIFGWRAALDSADADAARPEQSGLSR